MNGRDRQLPRWGCLSDFLALRDVEAVFRAAKVELRYHQVLTELVDYAAKNR
jgi:hypothetical protein